MLSRDKQDRKIWSDICECHVKTRLWYWSLSPPPDQTEPLWTSVRMLLQNVIHRFCCWYWPHLRIVGKYNSVEAAYELATFCTQCQHFLQIFSLVNVASFSHIISSLILQTILQTIPITLLGAHTCNALLCCYFSHFTIIYILKVLFFGQFYNQSLLLSTFWLQPNNIYSAELSPCVPNTYLKAFLFESPSPFVYLFSVLYSWLILYFYNNLALNHWGTL